MLFIAVLISILTEFGQIIQGLTDNQATSMVAALVVIAFIAFIYLGIRFIGFLTLVVTQSLNYFTTYLSKLDNYNANVMTMMANNQQSDERFRIETDVKFKAVEANSQKMRNTIIEYIKDMTETDIREGNVNIMDKIEKTSEKVVAAFEPILKKMEEFAGVMTRVEEVMVNLNKNDQDQSAIIKEMSWIMTQLKLKFLEVNQAIGEVSNEESTT
jgi:hypothetical protein